MTKLKDAGRPPEPTSASSSATSRRARRPARAATSAGSHQGQLDDRLTKAILATPVGGFTDVIDVPDDGLYLFKVLDEKTAAPDADQLATIKANAFGNWYTGKKAAVDDHPRPPRLAAGSGGPRCSTRSSPRHGSAGASTSPPGSRSSRPSASSARRSSRPGRR